jgi:hypothetical protein
MTFPHDPWFCERVHMTAQSEALKVRHTDSLKLHASDWGRHHVAATREKERPMNIATWFRRLGPEYHAVALPLRRAFHGGVARILEARWPNAASDAPELPCAD